MGCLPLAPAVWKCWRCFSATMPGWAWHSDRREMSRLEDQFRHPVLSHVPRPRIAHSTPCCAPLYQA
jgi:hypothetical protein